MPITAPLTDENSVMEPCSLACSISAFSTTRLSLDEANALRKQSETLPGALGNSVLRHTDEQTLVALVAVREAISTFDSPPADFEQWGIVCSSRYLGRQAFAQALTKFEADGPWNVSVQVVPNRSLHSPASMLGLALGCHGPCIGVGGGLDGETDAWLTAISLLDQKSLPGMWLVFTGWDPDERIDLEGNALNETRCTALVLALQPATVANGNARLRIACDDQSPTCVEVPARMTALQHFKSFSSAGRPLTINLGGGLRVDMDWAIGGESTILMAPPTLSPEPQRKAA